MQHGIWSSRIQRQENALPLYTSALIWMKEMLYSTGKIVFCLEVLNLVLNEFCLHNLQQY